MTSIILLTHNRWQFTEWCLEALERYTVWNNTELIVVDAGSEDAYHKRLCEALVSMDPVVSYSLVDAPAGNIGQSIRAGAMQAKLSDSDYSIILGNDHLVCPDWNTQILEAYQSVYHLYDVMDYTLPAARYHTNLMLKYGDVYHAYNISGHVIMRTERLLEQSAGHYLGDHATHADGHYWSWQPWIAPMRKAALYPPLPIIDLPRTQPGYPEYAFVEARQDEPFVQEIVAQEPWKLQDEYIQKGWTRRPV